jgi:hypothetical protein
MRRFAGKVRSMEFISKAFGFLASLILLGLFKILFDNMLYASFMSRLKRDYGIKEADVIAIVAANLIPLTAAVIVIFYIYLLAGRQRHQRIVRILNEILQRNQQLCKQLVTTDDDLNAWKASLNEYTKWIEKSLRGKISIAEINVLINGPSGPMLWFPNCGSRRGEMIYLHYLEERISKLIEKYS